MADWSHDACRCGHVRTAHVLGKRQPWPVTGRRYGRCTLCGCLELDIDAEAIAAAEAAIRAQRIAGVAEVLAAPRALQFRGR